MNSTVEDKDTNQFEPLDDPHLNVKDHFKSFIRDKSIEELIAVDNKLFSEVRNLENEKHILVTQNYKKFVASTETINTIKTSLVGFEKSLMILQGRVKNLVGNFNTINGCIEENLKESQNIYMIKKDLKRLKFINDLPQILETQLTAYLNNNENRKDISLLQKSLNYYHKCKEFLFMHKENSLVKGIFAQTNNLIHKYRNIIQDHLHFPDFNETNFENFEKGLSLLVIIEEDKSDLIATFLDRFDYLINKNFDEIFGMKEGVSEIDFKLYSKIYDNYEFSINENEFLFYETQILNSEKNLNTVSVINTDTIKNISSKYFKKGTFIWICKKIQENIIQSLLNTSQSLFVKLFGVENSQNLDSLFSFVVDLFFKKVNSIIEKNFSKNEIDPTFFKEGILAFYHSFCEIIQKVKDTNLDSNNIAEKILANNIKLTEKYIKNLEKQTAFEIVKCLENKFLILKQDKFNLQELISTTADLNDQIFSILEHNINMLKKLELSEIYNIRDCNSIYLEQILRLVNIFYYILKSSNSLKFGCLQNNKTNLNKEDLNTLKNAITKSPITKERIYVKIILVKMPLMNSTNSLKQFVDKLLNSFPQLKSSKNFYNETRSFIDKEINESLKSLLDSLIQLKDLEIHRILNGLFYNINWKTYEKAAAFRLEVRNLCFDLFCFKNELNDLLEIEKKNFEESNSSTINEAILWNKKQRRLTKYQKEMECLHIRRLSIYSDKNSSPQAIMSVLAKIFLKTINEMIKFKKFSQAGFQQIQLDMNLIKYFFRENIILDLENILDGFFLEIMKNCSFNTKEPELFDESLITELLEENRKEFKETFTK